LQGFIVPNYAELLFLHIAGYDLDALSGAVKLDLDETPSRLRGRGVSQIMQRLGGIESFESPQHFLKV
jgi:hypothetical protein